MLVVPPAQAGDLAALVAGRTAATPGIAGLAVVVATRDRVVRAEAYGAAVLDPPRPLRADTPLRVASISKAVVAVAVMRLVEAGKLDLDSDVARWLGRPLRAPAHPEVPITLRQLLSHTAGIEDGPGYRFPLGTDLIASLTPGHWSGAAPGTRFSYANLNYGIVATIMEAATGERFDRLMTRLVLAPLRLDAGYNWQGASDAALASAATLYRKGRDETAWNPAGPWIAQVDDLKGQRPACPVASDAGCDLAAYRPGTNGSLFSPQGGLRISALGLAKIGRLLLRGGEVDGVRLLSRRSVETLLTPVWRGDGPSGETYKGEMRCYGAGLQCLSGSGGDTPVAGARWWGHLGEAYGLLAGLWVDCAHGRVLVYAITGTADDPARAPHVSAWSGVEEAVLADLAATPLAARRPRR
ncbi:hypothetical protein IP88_00595 [alpha proteobacterium AAP81b]|nr:hypothetical protein IP88_00595 [alpha proteobacterium AAP81b]